MAFFLFGKPKVIRATVKIAISREAFDTINYVAKQNHVKMNDVVSQWLETQAKMVSQSASQGITTPQRKEGRKRK